MLGLQSATWALVLVLTTSFPSAVVTAPVDDASGSNLLSPRDAVTWIAGSRLTAGNFQTVLDYYSSHGYRLKSVSGYAISNDPRYTAILDTSAGSNTTSKIGMSSSQYQTQFNNYTAQGYRPILVDVYPVSGANQFAAIWDKSPSGGWIARHDMTADQYQTSLTEFSKLDYRLKHVSGYAYGNLPYYAAIWEKKTTNVAWNALHNMTSAQYQTALNKYAGQGYRVIHVDGYVVNNVDYYAAIWEQTTGGALVALHGMSASTFQAQFNNWLNQGYTLTVLSAYTLSGNQDTYAAIWVKY